MRDLAAGLLWRAIVSLWYQDCTICSGELGGKVRVSVGIKARATRLQWEAGYARFRDFALLGAESISPHKEIVGGVVEVMGENGSWCWE